MNLLELVTVITLAALAVGMIVWFGRVIFKALSPNFSKGGQLNPVALKENWEVKKRLALIAAIDQDLKAKKVGSACKRIREVFILEHVKGNAAFLESIRAHNYMGLTKIIAIAKEAKVVLPSISTIEALLDERSRLLALYQDSSTLHSKIKEKRQKEGKNTSWDGGEFESKIAELSEDIEKNRQDLQQEFDSVINLLICGSARDINIH